MFGTAEPVTPVRILNGSDALIGFAVSECHWDAKHREEHEQSLNHLAGFSFNPLWSKIGSFDLAGRRRSVCTKQDLMFEYSRRPGTMEYTS